MCSPHHYPLLSHMYIVVLSSNLAIANYYSPNFYKTLKDYSYISTTLPATPNSPAFSQDFPECPQFQSEGCCSVSSHYFRLNSMSIETNIPKTIHVTQPLLRTPLLILRIKTSILLYYYLLGPERLCLQGALPPCRPLRRSK